MSPSSGGCPGATLEAGAYTTIWFSGDEGKDGIHAGFRLGSSDDTLVLSDSTGNQISILTWPMDQDPGGGMRPARRPIYRPGHPRPAQQPDRDILFPGVCSHGGGRAGAHSRDPAA